MKAPLTPVQEALMKGIAREVREHVATKIKPLQDRIAELESRPVPEYRGIHRDGEVYHQAAMVTRDGALWFAKVATMTKPGSSPDWQLIVKSGNAPQQRTATSHRGP